MLQLYEVSADTTFSKPSDAACDVACFIYSLSDPKSFSYCASIYKVAGRDPGGLHSGPGQPQGSCWTSPGAQGTSALVAAPPLPGLVLNPSLGFLSLQQHYLDSQIPCVFVASKTDLPEASQQPGLFPAEFCYKHCLPPPFPFSCHSQGPPSTAVYTKLATAATFPLVSFTWWGSTGSTAWGGGRVPALPLPLCFGFSAAFGVI